MEEEESGYFSSDDPPFVEDNGQIFYSDSDSDYSDTEHDDRMDIDNQLAQMIQEANPGPSLEQVENQQLQNGSADDRQIEQEMQIGAEANVDPLGMPEIDIHELGNFLAEIEVGGRERNVNFLKLGNVRDDFCFKDRTIDESMKWDEFEECCMYIHDEDLGNRMKEIRMKENVTDRELIDMRWEIKISNMKEQEKRRMNELENKLRREGRKNNTFNIKIGELEMENEQSQGKIRMLKNMLETKEQELYCEQSKLICQTSLAEGWVETCEAKDRQIIKSENDILELKAKISRLNRYISKHQNCYISKHKKK